MNELESKLESLGVTKAAASRYFDVHRNTVARWCEFDCPAAVEMVVDSLIYDLESSEAELHFATRRIANLRDA